MSKSLKSLTTVLSYTLVMAKVSVACFEMMAPYLHNKYKL